MNLINLLFYVVDLMILTVSSVGNLFVIVVMLKEKTLRKSSANNFMICLAIVDFISDLFAIPFCIYVVSIKWKTMKLSMSLYLIFTEYEFRITC